MSSQRPKLQNIPGHLLTLADYAFEAKNFIDPPVHAWLESGAGDEQAVKAGAAAFKSLSIYNRVLADVSRGSTRLSLFGQPLDHPIMLAPLGYHRLVHPDGECATAAGALDTVYAVSSMASRSLEDIAAAASGPQWFQLYFQATREATLALLRRAEASGCKAVIVTLDAAVKPVGLWPLRAGFRMPHDVSAVNLSDPPRSDEAEGGWTAPGLNALSALAPTPDDLAWLRDQTSLPMIAKGITHQDDATALIKLGYDGIAVSAHGGRVLSAAPAPINVLPAIRQAVGPNIPLLVDGGIRTGVDVFKALALGANAVMIGRPQLHALSVAGSLGIAHMLKLLREELEVTMALAGCPTTASITPAALFRNTP